MIAPVPVHCFSITFKDTANVYKRRHAIDGCRRLKEIVEWLPFGEIADHSVDHMFSLHFDVLYFCNFPFWFEGWLWVLIDSVPDLCTLLLLPNHALFNLVPFGTTYLHNYPLVFVVVFVLFCFVCCCCLFFQEKMSNTTRSFLIESLQSTILTLFYFL